MFFKLIQRLAVELANVKVQNEPIGQLVEPVRVPLRLIKPEVEQLLSILFADPRHPRVLTQQHSRLIPLVFAEDVRKIRIVTAEMEKPQLLAVYRVTLPFLRDDTAVQVPISNIKSRIAENVVLEQSRHEIDPTLIGKAHSSWVDHAFPPQTGGPPIEKGLALRPYGDKTEIINSRSQDIAFTQTKSILRERLRYVLS